MKNIDKDLEEINNDFNDSIDSYDNGFSLTKMFKNSGMINKITKGLLLFSISAGAFANVTNAGKGLDNLIQQYEKPQTQSELIFAQKEQQLSEIKVDHNNFFSGMKLETLTPEIMDDAIKEGITGVFRMPDSKDPVILYQDGKFDKDSLSPDAKLELERVQEYLSEFSLKNDEPIARSFSNSTLKTINLVEDYVSVNHSDIVDDINTPLYKKYENEIQSLHEYAHAQKFQHDARKDINNGTKRNFNGTLMTEVSSDLYSVLGVVKKFNLNDSDTKQLLEEMSFIREETLIRNLDIGHATSPAINTFIKYLDENPSALDNIKKGDDQTLLSMTANYGHEFHKQIDLGSGVAKIKLHHFQKDVKLFLEKGDSFDIKDTNAYKGLSGSKLDVESLLEKVDYEGYLKNLSDEYKNDGGTLKTIIRKNEGSTLHYKALNQINLLYKYEDVLMKKDNLDNIASNHLDKIEELNQIKDLKLETENIPVQKMASNINTNKLKI